MTDAAESNLARRLNRAFALLTALQARALVIERQAAAAADGDKLLKATAKAHVAFQQSASIMLDELLPEAITSALTPVDRTLNLARAVETSLPRGDVAPAEVAIRIGKHFRALSDSAAETGRKSGDAAVSLREWSKDLRDRASTLEESCIALVQSLEDDDGKLAALRRTIAATRGEIDEALDGIVTSAGELGDRAGDLATSALTVISTKSEPRPTKPQQKDAEVPSSPAKPAAKPVEPKKGLFEDDDDVEESDADNLLINIDKGTKRPDKADVEVAHAKHGREEAEARARAQGGQTVQTLKATEKSARTMGGAFATLNRKNDELADLYLELAQSEGRLAWAEAVGGQAASMLTASKAASDAFDLLSEGWTSVAQTLREQAEELEGDGDLAALRDGWTRFTRLERVPLADRLPNVRAALTSGRKLAAI